MVYWGDAEAPSTRWEWDGVRGRVPYHPHVWPKGYKSGRSLALQHGS